MKKIKYTGGQVIKLKLPGGETRKLVPGQEIMVVENYAENLTLTGNFKLVEEKEQKAGLEPTRPERQNKNKLHKNKKGVK